MAAELLITTPLIGIYTGRPQKLMDGRRSAMNKLPVRGTVALTETGLEGDKVADGRFHGGPEQALHHYPAERYAVWAARFPEIADALVPGSIGENIASFGLTEENVHIGDVYRWGEAEIEVSQPRMPCIKINSRYGVEGLTEVIMETGHCGWYYRVLRTGTVTADEPLERLHRPSSSVSLAEFWAVQNAHRPGIAALRRVAESPRLAEKWQRKFQQRIRWLEKNAASE